MMKLASHKRAPNASATLVQVVRNEQSGKKNCEKRNVRSEKVNEK